MLGAAPSSRPPLASAAIPDLSLGHRRWALSVPPRLCGIRKYVCGPGLFHRRRLRASKQQFAYCMRLLLRIAGADCESRRYGLHASLPCSRGHAPEQVDPLFENPDRIPQGAFDDLLLFGVERFWRVLMADVAAISRQLFVLDLPERSAAVGTAQRRRRAVVCLHFL